VGLLVQWVVQWVELYYFGHRPEKPAEYLAYWHTHGGAHHYFIVSEKTAKQLIAKDRYWKVEREVTGQNFFDVFSRYADFAVKKVGDIYYVAVDPNFMGWWIGKDGWRINTIKDILGAEIKLLYCIFIAESGMKWYLGQARFTEGRRGLKYDEPGEYIAIEWEGDFVKQLSISQPIHGFIAPWQIKRVLGILRIGGMEEGFRDHLLNNPEALRLAIKQVRKMFQLMPWIKVEDNGEVKEI